MSKRLYLFQYQRLHISAAAAAAAAVVVVVVVASAAAWFQSNESDRTNKIRG
jgi:hypothetical protein